MTKVNAIKSSAIIFSLIHASLSVESEAGGPWGIPIFQDGHRSVQCEVDSSGQAGNAARVPGEYIDSSHPAGF